MASPVYFSLDELPLYETYLKVIDMLHQEPRDPELQMLFFQLGSFEKELEKFGIKSTPNTDYVSYPRVNKWYNSIDKEYINSLLQSRLKRMQILVRTLRG